jgi:hypothetical protein
MHDILLPANRLIRLRNSYRYPFQSAVAARLPLVGMRVPMRPYWRRQPLGAMRPVERYLDRYVRAATRTGAWCSAAALGTTEATRRATATTRRAVRFDRRTMPMIVAGVVAGGLAVFYLDPQEGRRRRALLRDRFAHLGHVVTRDVPRRVERRGRFIRGVAKGVTHEAAELAHINGGHAAVVDDDTLVARVRSEALRDRHFKAGEIHLDAYEGCVTLRGQMDEHDIHELIDATKHVEGVREVRSYLHTPGTPPPNKAEAYKPHPAPVSVT